MTQQKVAQSTTRARRGDVVAVVSTDSSVSVEHGLVERQRVELRKVVGITRDGLVARTETDYGQVIQRKHEEWKRPTYLVIPQDTVDVDALLAAYEEHQWPGAEDRGYRHTMPFDSVDECRAFVRPFLAVTVQS